MKKNGDLKLSKEYIQVLFIDKNGDGKAAKERDFLFLKRKFRISIHLYFIFTVLKKHEKHRKGRSRTNRKDSQEKGFYFKKKKLINNFFFQETKT